jgi:hypothetical protein
LRIKVLPSACVIAYEERGVKNCARQNPKRNPAQTPIGFAQIVSD